MSKKNTEEPKVTKQFLLDHLEEDVLDLSVCSLTKFPAKELVSHWRIVVCSHIIFAYFL